MKICVGSRNPVKLEAVMELFPKDEIISYKANSSVNEQPMSLGETLKGAKNRAYEAYNSIHASGIEDYIGIGIESGIMPSKEAKTGYFNTCASVIYNGKDYFIGLSSGFEHPKEVLELITKDCDVSNAYFKAGLTDNPRIGYSKGAIFILTKGLIDRKEYTKQGLRIAKASFENKSE
ncbi:MAG: inosine/xanthosine triphosphatase [Candidatus Nanoarchaeia archaeon]|jgi:inosine/xanthosine triphosphatase